MPDAQFDQTLQIGIVVHDLDATIRRYEEDFGIGPWQRWEADLGEAEAYREDGVPARAHSRVAMAKIGGVYWELIQPLDGESIFGRFLAEKGPGVHHVAVGVRDFAATVERAQARGPLPLRAHAAGVDVAFLDTAGDLGVLLEIASGMPVSASA